MICNNTLQVSSIRYSLSGVYVTFAVLQELISAKELTQVYTHTQRDIFERRRNGHSLETACRQRSLTGIFLLCSSSGS